MRMTNYIYGGKGEERKSGLENEKRRRREDGRKKGKGGDKQGKEGKECERMRAKQKETGRAFSHFLFYVYDLQTTTVS